MTLAYDSCPIFCRRTRRIAVAALDWLCWTSMTSCKALADPILDDRETTLLRGVPATDWARVPPRCRRTVRQGYGVGEKMVLGSNA